MTQQRIEQLRYELNYLGGDDAEWRLRIANIIDEILKELADRL